MKAVKRDAREMKDSGNKAIRWIPIRWHVPKTLYGLSMPITDGPHITPDLYSDGVPFVSAEAVSAGNGSIDFNHMRGYISEAFYEECSKKYVPQRNDIFMIKSGATTGKVSIVDTDRKFTIWSPLAVFRVNGNRFIPRYVFYYLQSDAYQKQVELKWSFGTQQNIGMRTLEQLRICMPTLAEQQTIADYLDDRCAKIDAIIAEAKASIEEYKELKQAVIYEAVTKGLDKNVAMKDSGIFSVDEIPSHWETIKLNLLAKKIGDGLHGTPNFDSFGDYYFVNGNNLGDKCIAIKENTKRINALEATNYQIKLSSNTILISLNGTIGNVSNYFGEKVVLGKSAGYIDLHDNVMRDYIRYYLKSPSTSMVFDMKRTGTTIFNLSLETLRNLKICFPPRSEQLNIVEYLNKKTTELEQIISEKQSLIEDLESYKKSLIYEVVTGKRKVVD